MPRPVPYNTLTSTPEAAPQTAAADRPLPPNTHQSSEPISTNGWGDSAGNASHNGWSTTVGSTTVDAGSSGWMDNPSEEDYNGWGLPDSGPVGHPTQQARTNDNISTVVPTNNDVSTPISSASVPSAPPIPDEVLDKWPIHYPPTDFSPVKWSIPAREDGGSVTNDVKDEGNSSSCVICCEAPIEGACIPCGHMAGCMCCLNEIKANKKGACPVCRVKINQVLRLYAV